jgi:hypothetical protein
MSTWVIAGLLLNVAVVAVAVVLVLRFAGPRSVHGAVAPSFAGNAGPSPRPRGPTEIRLPSLNPTDTRRVEWLALLDAFERARVAYARELAMWHAGPKRYGALSRTKHALDVARKRLNRFERELVRRA